MGIQSIGVGSGLALDDLVTQLVDAERAPRQARLDEREETLDAQISAIGSLTSRLGEFEDAVDELRSSFNLNNREPTITHPNQNDLAEGDSGAFTAEASSSATEATYEVAITQLAEGSRIETADGAFASTSAVATAAGGNLRFGVGSDSFDVNISAGATLSQLRDAINLAARNFAEADSNNFTLNASIIDTGTAVGSKLVFTSDATGAGNDLIVTNLDDDADLINVATQDSLGAVYNTNTDGSGTGAFVRSAATDALATIDGIAVQSSTNTFENVIQNVSFEALEVSEETTAGSGVFRTSTLQIGNDTQGLDQRIRDFTDNYNNIIDEINRLTRFGESELEDDGALAGDFLARGIQSSLASIVSGSVPGSSLGTLFQIGISFDEDGKLNISSTDDFGQGSGEDLLRDALDDNFDEVGNLFSDADNGIAARLYDYVREFTQSGGILRTREQSFRDERSALDEERERFELQILNFENIQRDRFIALDQTVASLNRTGNALLSSLASLG